MENQQASERKARVLPQVRYHPTIQNPTGAAAPTRTTDKADQENQAVEPVKKPSADPSLMDGGPPPRPEQVPLGLKVQMDQRLARTKCEITASMAHNIAQCPFVNGESETPPTSFFAAITGKSIRTRGMSWGVEMKDKAIVKYQRLKREPISVLRCGLFIEAHHPWLAASPDGIVTDRQSGELCLEVKCPYKHKHRRLEDACRVDRAFCLEIQDEDGEQPEGSLTFGVVIWEEDPSCGSVPFDHRNPSKALLCFQSPFVMGTFNVCTLNTKANVLKLAECATEIGMEILGIQEHRKVHAGGGVKYQRVGRYTFVTASAWRNNAGAGTGGVGLLLGSLASKALRRAYPHTNRILIAEFSGNPETTVIVVYSPTNVAPREEVERLYQDLDEVIQDVPAHNFLAILGDFNARLGQRDALFPFQDSTNRNGKYLANLLRDNKLLAANTIFYKSRDEQWTFESRAKNFLCQLDYILVRQRWWNSILDAEPLNTFSSLGSDHRVVSMWVQLGLMVTKPSPKMFPKDPVPDDLMKGFQQLDIGARPKTKR
ncbi:uncharacterized protein ACBR49_004161 [Aulostomus maculatus]